MKILYWIGGFLVGGLLFGAAIAFGQGAAYDASNGGAAGFSGGAITSAIVCPDGSDCLARPSDGSDVAYIQNTAPDRHVFEVGVTAELIIDSGGLIVAASDDVEINGGDFIDTGASRWNLATDGYGKLSNNASAATMELLVPQTSDPCGTAIAGALFYNATSNYFCFCNGAGADIKMNDNTTACF